MSNLLVVLSNVSRGTVKLHGVRLLLDTLATRIDADDPSVTIALERVAASAYVAIAIDAERALRLFPNGEIALFRLVTTPLTNPLDESDARWIPAMTLRLSLADRFRVRRWVRRMVRAQRAVDTAAVIADVAAALAPSILTGPGAPGEDHPYKGDA